MRFRKGREQGTGAIVCAAVPAAMSEGHADGNVPTPGRAIISCVVALRSRMVKCSVVVRKN